MFSFGTIAPPWLHKSPHISTSSHQRELFSMGTTPTPTPPSQALMEATNDHVPHQNETFSFGTTAPPWLHPDSTHLQAITSERTILHGHHPHPNPALMSAHRRHKRPDIAGGVVHLHAVQIGLAVVASYRVHLPVGRCHGNAAALDLHGLDVLPGVGLGVVALDRLEEHGAVVPPHRVQPPVERGHAQTAALRVHRRHGSPQPRGHVETLHLEGKEREREMF